MSSLTTAGNTAPDNAGLATPQARRNIALLLFVALSLLVSMLSITQEKTPEVGSISYWLLIVPAVLLPFANLPGIVKALLGRARLVLVFGITAGAWQLMHDDLRALQQLVLIVWVMGWLCTAGARLAVHDLVRIYLALVLIGTSIWLLTDINKWGILPGTTTYDGLDWRISFFPNIAMSGLLSLILVFALTRTIALARRYKVVLALALYFLIFSFVRSAIIAFGLYIFMRWWLAIKPRSSRATFWMALLLGVAINLAIAVSTPIFNQLQQIEIISRLFLRSETGLSQEEIYVQLYRPWVWMQHLKLFWSSPSLMGLGAFDFNEMQFEELNAGTTPTGNEALLTRLLATYGLPASAVLLFFITRLRAAVRDHDDWACACFPPIVLLMMQWGNIFHPSDAIGAILTLIAINGHRAFVPRFRAGYPFRRSHSGMEVKA